MNAPHVPAQFKTRKTNVAEIQTLIEAGLMDHQDPYELINGVLYEMPSEGFDHAEMKNRIAEWLHDNLDRDRQRVFVDTPLYLDDQNAPEADIYVFPRGLNMRELAPSDVSLVIEVANSSLGKDKELKAPLYARFDITEYWIIDLDSSTLLFFSDNGDGTYGEPERFTSTQSVTSKSLNGLSFRIADLNV